MLSLMGLKSYLNRPEYVLRPSLAVRRLLFRNCEKNPSAFLEVNLPWDMRIRIRPVGPGLAIWRMRVYDLAVTEVLWRLVDRGELAIDVGANIGYMTSILAKRAGACGKVLCFEPHPLIYQELMHNVNEWQKRNGCSLIRAMQIAVSNRSGKAVLHEPIDFENNAGTASLHPVEHTGGTGTRRGGEYVVPVATLAQIAAKEGPVGVLKIDVENHELQVLQGSVGLLAAKLVRDIVFEEHACYPSAVGELLQEYGYKVFRIWKSFHKPLLLDPALNRFHPWEPANYLATSNASRAVERLGKMGWLSLLGKA
jgi:FkbM family methyltransferase